MPRSRPSQADQELLALLSHAGFECSPFRLERWRTQGLLPRAEQRHPGGGGSVSELPHGTPERAAWLSANARRGVAWQVLALGLLEEGHIDLSDEVLRQALGWLVRRDFKAFEAERDRVRQRLERHQQGPDELDLAEALAAALRGSRQERVAMRADYAIVKARYPQLKRGELFDLLRTKIVWSFAELLGEQLEGETKALAQGFLSQQDAEAAGFIGTADPRRVTVHEQLRVAANTTLYEFVAFLGLAADTLGARWWQSQPTGFGCRAALRTLTQVRVAKHGDAGTHLTEEDLDGVFELLLEKEADEEKEDA